MSRKFHGRDALNQRGQRGTSLIEVLVSVLIMAVGMLGIAAMQATALRNSQSSTERSQAVIASYAIIDAMRANRVGAIAGSYNTTGWSCALPAAGTLAGNDMRAWMTALRTSIGADETDATICGSINCTAATGICVVGVRWDDSRGGATGGAQAGSAEYSIQTRVRM
jgi:type IV pilus assembly protein PilV